MEGMVPMVVAVSWGDRDASVEPGGCLLETHSGEMPGWKPIPK